MYLAADRGHRDVVRMLTGATDIDVNSPGSVGIWLGLQILNSYADKNNVSLIDILNETDYMKILNKSGYKP